MRPSLFALGVLATLAAAGPVFGGQAKQPTEPAGWHTYVPSGAGFQVTLPGRPAVEEDRGLPEEGIGSTRKAVAVSPEALGFAVIDHEFLEALDVDVVQFYLEAIEGNLLAQYPGQVRVQRSLSVHGFAARELVIEMPGEGVMHIRIVVARDRLYVLMVGVPAGVAESADIERFFESFRPVGTPAAANSDGQGASLARMSYRWVPFAEKVRW